MCQTHFVRVSVLSHSIHIFPFHTLTLHLSYAPFFFETKLRIVTFFIRFSMLSADDCYVFSTNNEPCPFVGFLMQQVTWIGIVFNISIESTDNWIKCKWSRRIISPAAAQKFEKPSVSYDFRIGIIDSCGQLTFVGIFIRSHCQRRQIM